MGALDVIFRLLKPGDEIIAGNDLYGGSNRLIGYLKTHGGITTHHVDTTDPTSLVPLLEDPSRKVAMVLLESPTNPLLQIADLETIARLVRTHRPEALVVVDNTMMSPYLCRPLELGCDVVYDSGTKYLSGHHDLMAGVITCDRDDVAKGIAFTINSIGNGLSPFDAFLLLRGVKTLSLRIDKQQANSVLIAQYLDHLGFKVNYPGLPSHRGKAVHDRIASGPGAVLSFETGDVAMSERIVGSARLWGISVSFGCINSLISMPCLMSCVPLSLLSLEPNPNLTFLPLLSSPLLLPPLSSYLPFPPSLPRPPAPRPRPRPQQPRLDRPGRARGAQPPRGPDPPVRRH